MSFFSLDRTSSTVPASASTSTVPCWRTIDPSRLTSATSFWDSYISFYWLMTAVGDEKISSHFQDFRQDLILLLRQWNALSRANATVLPSLPVFEKALGRISKAATADKALTAFGCVSDDLETVLKTIHDLTQHTSGQARGDLAERHNALMRFQKHVERTKSDFDKLISTSSNENILSDSLENTNLMKGGNIASLHLFCHEDALVYEFFDDAQLQKSSKSTKNEAQRKVAFVRGTMEVDKWLFQQPPTNRFDAAFLLSTLRSVHPFPVSPDRICQTEPLAARYKELIECLYRAIPFQTDNSTARKPSAATANLVSTSTAASSTPSVNVLSSNVDASSTAVKSTTSASNASSSAVKSTSPAFNASSTAEKSTTPRLSSATATGVRSSPTLTGLVDAEMVALSHLAQQIDAVPLEIVAVAWGRYPKLNTL
ncbi:hypothetical protein CAOG_02271 [Capsaspora owczarzaki ATCC 30864]|uniref:Uncharacterized protein n=1 Tax=Capsaspora owczarzaki (strain ATCC 30864) TaxID=595528 RepID=A0A0D2VLU4_CAPO3|nr:hypothetical protein CAOG_02271 [Capsaspora owczarzaki ATCC 30864]KJE91082.1 hypothetical protein CAOG_002271 [Capsaspora owczarzaki ATCC 30864]|eukprot:XP_004349021.1 hypothetical protein CAOG_02271 [Capsaspora owczarzaki ATCC 30864]